MGDRDSSLTRVQPIFDELLSRDSTGATWLAKLLALPARPQPNPITVTAPIDEREWGTSEKALSPPVPLLRWMVTHPENLVWPKMADSCSETTNKLRKALFAGDEQVKNEALRLLAQSRVPHRDWFVLEGPTYPDVFLRTAELTVVIEGKRTERAITTATSWMPVRHQMIRHLDAAWEVRGSTRVLGFFIVEGQGDDVEVPLAWQQTCAETINPDVLRLSLPHRTDEERAQLADAFLGVTTWQRLCQVFLIPWAPLQDLRLTAA